MEKAQYRKYKEIYRINLDILKKIIKDCDANINEINIEIDKKNNKQKDGGTIKKIDNTEIIYLLIPSS